MNLDFKFDNHVFMFFMTFFMNVIYNFKASVFNFLKNQKNWLLLFEIHQKTIAAQNIFGEGKKGVGA